MTRVRQLGLVIEARRDQYPLFTRPFSPTVDALYIRGCELEGMVLEALELPFYPALEGRNVTIFSHFRRIAMSETSLSGDHVMGDIAELLCSFTPVEELLVLVDAPPALESVGVKSLWRFASAPGDAFCWTRNGVLFEICVEGEHIGDGVVAALIDRNRDYLAEEFNRLRVPQSSFTVRPVFACLG